MNSVLGLGVHGFCQHHGELEFTTTSNLIWQPLQIEFGNQLQIEFDNQVKIEFDYQLQIGKFDVNYWCSETML